MNVSHLRLLVNLEKNSRAFPRIHKAVNDYISGMTVSEDHKFWSQSNAKYLTIPSYSVITAGQNEGKLAAVKLYKNESGNDVVTSKRAVEDYFETKGYTFK